MGLGDLFESTESPSVKDRYAPSSKTHSHRTRGWPGLFRFVKYILITLLVVEFLTIMILLGKVIRNRERLYASELRASLNATQLNSINDTSSSSGPHLSSNQTRLSAINGSSSEVANSTSDDTLTIFLSDDNSTLTNSTGSGNSSNLSGQNFTLPSVSSSSNFTSPKNSTSSTKFVAKRRLEGTIGGLIFKMMLLVYEFCAALNNDERMLSMTGTVSAMSNLLILYSSVAMTRQRSHQSWLWLGSFATLCVYMVLMTFCSMILIKRKGQVVHPMPSPVNNNSTPTNQNCSPTHFQTTEI